MTGLSARSRIVGCAIVGMHVNRSDPKRAEGLAVWNSWRVKDVMIPQSGSGVEYMYVGHVVVMGNMVSNASVGMAGCVATSAAVDIIQHRLQENRIAQRESCQNKSAQRWRHHRLKAEGDQTGLQFFARVVRAEGSLLGIEENRAEVWSIIQVFYCHLQKSRALLLI